MSVNQQQYISVTGSFCITPDTAGVTDLNPQAMTLRNAWFSGTVTAGAFVTSGGGTPGPATFSQITITQGTIAALATGIAQTVTWNNAAVVFTAQSLSVTDTASGAGSLLVNYLVGGASKFSVSKSGFVTAASSLYSSAAVTAAAANGFIYAGKSQSRSSTDGQVNLLNNAATGFTRLTLGPETALFPSLKVNGAALQFRLGDDSNFTDVEAANVKTNGNLNLQVVGNGLVVKSGANSRIGSAVLVGGTVTVANTSVTANTLILLTVKTDGGTVGNLSYTVIAGTSFTINSSNALDTSTVNWFLIETS